MTTAKQRETILKKAYEIWEAEGRPHGRDLEHWLKAELAIFEENKKAPKAPAKRKAPVKKTAAKTTTKKPAAKSTTKPAAKKKTTAARTTTRKAPAKKTTAKPKA